MAELTFDAQSAAPLRAEAAKAMVEAMAVPQADPGRNHAVGRATRDLLEHARHQVANFTMVSPRQVSFVSSLPEAAATVIAHARQSPGAVVTSGIDRTSVRTHAEVSGPVRLLGVDPKGHLDPAALDHLLRAEPVSLVCLQVANQETGVLQDLEPLLECCRSHGVATYLDASTAAGHLELDLGRLGATFSVISSEGIGGPMGLVALCIERGRILTPLLLGGAQERGRRAGLEPVLLAVGMGAAAAALSPLVIAAEAERATRQITELVEQAKTLGGVRWIGHDEGASTIAHLCCLGIDGVEAEAVVVSLDRLGVAAHSGSACASEDYEPSPVLAAMGLEASEALQLSVHHSTSDEDVARAAAALSDAVGSLRALRR